MITPGDWRATTSPNPDRKGQWGIVVDRPGEARAWLAWVNPGPDARDNALAMAGGPVLGRLLRRAVELLEQWELVDAHCRSLAVEARHALEEAGL